MAKRAKKLIPSLFIGCFFLIIFVLSFGGADLFSNVFSPIVCTSHPEQILDSAWTIPSYDVNVDLAKDGSFLVKETINADFNTQKHGIYRYIPVLFERKMPDGSYNDSLWNVDVVSVTQDGKPATFTQDLTRNEGCSQKGLPYSDFAKSVFLKIGDASELVYGNVKYEITYSVKNGLSNDEKSNPQLYMNVIGTGFPVPITAANIQINDTQNLFDRNSQSYCYAGSFGANNKQCNISKQAEITNLTSTNLEAFEGVTFLQNLDKEKSSQYSSNIGGGAKELITMAIQRWYITFLIIPFFITALVWYLFGRDPETRGIIAPRFDAPKGITPSQAGVVVDESVDNTDISASIIHLAIKGHLKIEKTDNSYVFTKTTPKKNYEMSRDEKIIYDGIFSNGNIVNLDTLKYTFYPKYNLAKTELYNWGVMAGYFKRTPGFFSCSQLFTYASFIPFILIFIAGVSVIYDIFFVIVALCTIPFILMFKSYTKEGKELQEELLGLKMYIETAEKDRINYLNAPAKTPELFERLLPYAMVLDVVEIWAKEFKDIYKQQPDWYTDSNWNTFNTLYFINSLNSASASINSTMTSVQPSSSSSGGGFGGGFSGGGGSSGGGGGGGGGGSW